MICASRRSSPRTRATSRCSPSPPTGRFWRRRRTRARCSASSRRTRALCKRSCGAASTARSSSRSPFAQNRGSSPRPRTRARCTSLASALLATFRRRHIATGAVRRCRPTRGPTSLSSKRSSRASRRRTWSRSGPSPSCAASTAQPSAALARSPTPSSSSAATARSSRRALAAAATAGASPSPSLCAARRRRRTKCVFLGPFAILKWGRWQHGSCSISNRAPKRRPREKRPLCSPGPFTGPFFGRRSAFLRPSLWLWSLRLESALLGALVSASTRPPE
mmetsp:Transcript_31817/g.109431  ORF Transcript_31817/g.109431 Transcript_31817/m.109431 type:complete len:278 (+) Transcript_31817:581-1414(+)